MDNYSEAPISINELKADKFGDASYMQPRDALISALRQIDSGQVDPDECIIVFGTILDDASASTRVVIGTSNMYTALGLLSDAESLIRDA